MHIDARGGIAALIRHGLGVTARCGNRCRVHVTLVATSRDRGLTGTIGAAT